jgi:DNA-binding response OmpR family regulator
MARISIISDDPNARYTARSTLEGTHEVRLLGSRDLSASSLARGEPDVLVVDAEHVEAIGAALTRDSDLSWLGTDKADTGVAVRTQAPRILVLLSPGQEDRIMRLFDGGASDYLFKPISEDALKTKVDVLLAQRLGLFTQTATINLDPIAISDDGRLLRNDEEDDDIQAVLGRYEVRGVLGRGGYGVVYRAHDMATDREVALKVLPKKLNGNPEAVARFFRESTAISRLNHPNIVKFYEVGSYQDRLYYTMELVEGRTLKDLCESEAPMPTARAARYVAGIAEALCAISSIGLVHRDIKPENVLITEPFEQVKLIDFGLVRINGTAAITSDDDVLGTPYFMCPEYIREPGVPDIRYDLYALGVTFFNLLTGEYPFDGKNAAHVMEKHLRCKAPKVSRFQRGVPFLAERIIDRLLRKDPKERPQTPQEVLILLEPLLA